MKQFLIGLLCIILLSTSAFAFSPYKNKDLYYPDPNEVTRFIMALAQVKQLYVEEETDKDLFANAISGLLEKLDPHSSYLDEESMKELNEQTNGNFTGVGIEITAEKGALKVIAPLDDSPADKAGIKAGDYILAVNNKSILNTPINKVIKEIRGKPGTKVILTIANKKEAKPRNVEIIRKKIDVNSVKTKLLPDGIGYVRISQFQSDTGKKLISEVQALQKKAGGKLNGIILDLRNNPGGLLDSSVEVVDAFIDSNLLGENKKIIYTKGRITGANITFKAHPGDILHGAPIIILINQGSASGSEIVAGAMQDHKRAVVVGQTSFGKGSVQTLLPLIDGTGIKLTTSLYYTPKGRSIQAEGIKPDVMIEDLEINKKKEDILALLNISEKNLSGHLENETAKTATDKKDEGKINSESILPEKDYPLYQAFLLLKTMMATSKLGTSN